MISAQYIYIYKYIYIYIYRRIKVTFFWICGSCHSVVETTLIKPRILVHDLITYNTSLLQLVEKSQNVSSS